MPLADLLEKKKSADLILISAIIFFVLGTTGGIWELKATVGREVEAEIIGGLLLLTWLLIRFKPPMERRSTPREEIPQSEREKQYLNQITSRMSLAEASKLPSCPGVKGEELRQIVNEQYLKCAVCRGDLKRIYQHGIYFVEPRNG